MLSNEEIGLRIKSEREYRELTQQDIANKIGVDKSTIQRYEAGTIQKIKLPVISAIAKVLKVNPSWIVGKSENKEYTEHTEIFLEDAYFNFAKEMQDNNVSVDDMKKLWDFYNSIKNK